MDVGVDEDGGVRATLQVDARAQMFPVGYGDVEEYLLQPTQYSTKPLLLLCHWVDGTCAPTLRACT